MLFFYNKTHITCVKSLEKKSLFKHQQQIKYFLSTLYSASYFTILSATAIVAI